MKTRRPLYRSGLTVPALLLAAACGSPAAPEDSFPIPAQTTDGWQTASLESVGMDPAPLQALLDLITTTPDHRMHGIVIIKDQRLVFEQYWPGVDLEPVTLNPVSQDFDGETLHYVASVSKSLTSALVGVALDQGLIGGVDDSLFSFFPEYGGLRNEDNGPVTLKHLLSFSSGLDWNEHVYGFGDPRDSHYRMFNTPDPVRFLLERPVVDPPGSRFHYNSGDTNLVGEIVRRGSGSESLVEFAHENLFQPLGIDAYRWWRFPLVDEVTFASGGAFLRPRDMAKFGTLYLNGGLWDGRQVVPAEWVEASTLVATPLPSGYRTVHGYGYNWWLGGPQREQGMAEHFRASGWGGQEIYVFPELDLVLVFTAGGYYEDPPLDFNDLIVDFILEAIKD
jgi:CubicO group peptidase (beta-lactamase class C family)